MIKLYKGISVSEGTMVGLVECDLDLDAERCIIMDRNTMTVFANAKVNTSGVLKRIIPREYAVNNHLLIGIIDDTGEFNAVFADGVKAQLVDINTVDMSQ
ncbi:hypothetical protein L2755_22025 [Shewanella abyssi]|uniref:hypothetical protein n=1 Tax=Shewanella abyssi TaxID=311789 RepID=UPI00200E3F5A|nr:hypothetical protein [Shewanella abyssi]MCL1052255.1 hypothetical protein [Shewanella abyssi]